MEVIWIISVKIGMKIKVTKHVLRPILQTSLYIVLA